MEEYQENSLSGRVFQKIRDDILSGKYKENEELRENTIGQELGVSRTPVREALRQLELEGLVTIIPNKGAFVTGISMKDVSDIYAIRSMLEGLCVRWATENITDEQLNELDEIVYLSEYHLKKEGRLDPKQLTDLDTQFHEVLYEACGSRILARTLSEFHKYVQRARTSSVVIEERARKSVREHRQILHAIRDKDVELAESLANEHIIHAMENILRNGTDEDMTTDSFQQEENDNGED